MKFRALLFCCFSVLCTVHTGFADQGDIQVALKGGTLGVGAEISVGLTDSMILRGGADYMKFNFDSTIDQVDYNMEPELKNASLLLDWHPFANGFRLTGGVYLNNNKINIDGTYRKETIPGQYQQYAHFADAAHVRGTVDFNTIAPYAGLGWRSNHGKKGWGVAFDLGIMFQGEPNVSDLHTESNFDLESHPEVVRFLDEQKQAIEDDLDEFQYYPVASINLTYNF